LQCVCAYCEFIVYANSGSHHFDCRILYRKDKSRCHRNTRIGIADIVSGVGDRRITSSLYILARVGRAFNNPRKEFENNLARIENMTIHTKLFGITQGVPLLLYCVVF